MADLDALESAVDDLEGDFVNLEQRVVELERIAATATENVGYLRSRIVELEDRIAHVANKMTTWAARKVIDAQFCEGVQNDPRTRVEPEG